MKSKFNSNYLYNSKHNKAKIKKIVEKLKEDKVNPHPHDFLFRYNTQHYPKLSHDELDLPGEFQKTEDTAVFVRDKGVSQMDYSESVTPKDKKEFKRDSANNVEQYTGELDPNKIEKLYEYYFYNSLKLKKPCYTTVVTDYDYGKEFKDYVVEGFSFRIYFKIFNEEKIYEMLNTLMNKDYYQEELSDAEYLRIINCITFAKKSFAQDVIEKASYLFASIEKIKINHQLDLHLALKIMIKYHFVDDDEKLEELLTVITNAVDTTRIDELDGYEVKQYTNQELKEENTKLKTENEELRVQRDAEKELRVQKDKEISQKDAEIKRLKDCILENGYVIPE